MWRSGMAAMGSRAWLGGGEKLSRGCRALLFIGQGVLARAT
jgi:hypothetical protein